MLTAGPTSRVSGAVASQGKLSAYDQRGLQGSARRPARLSWPSISSGGARPANAIINRRSTGSGQAGKVVSLLTPDQPTAALPTGQCTVGNSDTTAHAAAPTEHWSSLGQPTSATEKRGLAVRGPVPCGAELGLGKLRESRRSPACSRRPSLVSRTLHSVPGLEKFMIQGGGHCVCLELSRSPRHRRRPRAVLWHRRRQQMLMDRRVSHGCCHRPAVAWLPGVAVQNVTMYIVCCTAEPGRRC